MKNSIHSSLALRGFCLLFLAVLSLLAGCEKVRNWYTARESDNPHSVTINWTPSTSTVAGYNVYRASPPGAAPVKLTANLVSGTQYVDRTVEAGHTYSYSVKAVDAKGIESKPSEIVTVTVPKAATPPAKQ
jgi:fibronectin type 3 domain-containing protein